MSDTAYKPRIAALIGIVGFGSVILVAWVIFRALHPLPATQPSTDEVAVILKGSLGEAMFAGTETGTAAPQLNSPPSQGVLLEYKKNPDKFKSYATLFDTATNAMRIGNEVRKMQGSYKFPFESTDLRLATGDLRDAWNHPYCVNRVGTTIAVVSGGPGVTSFNCSQQQVRDLEISSSAKPVFQTARGEVVVAIKERKS